MLLLSIFIILIFAEINFIGCHIEEENHIKTFPSFVTTDLHGREVTNSIFANNYVTALNIWVTDSESCRKLQPKLWQLSKELNVVQFITLVGNKDIREAKIITSDSPNNFVNLIVNDDFNDLLVTINQVPITIFIDNTGNIIGQAVLGDDIELIRLELRHLLEINSPDYKNLQLIQNAIF